MTPKKNNITTLLNSVVRSSSYWFPILLVLVSTKIVYGTGTKKKDILDYVDPMIGTDGIGHTFPGATTPFGMIQLSPSDDTPEWNWCSGYHYSDKTIKGFAHNHFSGTGLAGLGDILLMPSSGKVNVKAGTKEDPDMGFRSRFSHDNETSSPGYYSVLLDDNKVKVELTATPRTGIHRYVFSEVGNHNVIMDPTHGVRHKLLGSSIQIISNTEISGHKYSHDQSCGVRKVFFYAKFSKPVDRSGIALNDLIIKNKTAEGHSVKAFAQFDGVPNDTLVVKVGISYVNLDGAKANLMSESEGRSFEEIHAQARRLWDGKISRIEIEGATEEQKKIFYTGMYHNFIAPNIISDVNGNYILEGKLHNIGKGVQYSNYSTWDTYRATHPLWSIIDQESNKKMINALLTRFTDTQTGLFLWEALGFDNYCMPGYPGIAVLAEAALKHPEDLNTDLIYNSIRTTAFRDGGASVNYGSDNGVRYYIDYGYVPAEVGCGVSKTTENNYYDFAIAQLAGKLNKKEDYNYFLQRSLGHRNLYNSDTKYLWPRSSSGRFVEMDTMGWDELVHHYVSGNIWAYSTYTPHDMLGVIQLFGDKDKYDSWLSSMIKNPLEMAGEQHVDIAGFIGKYSHGDEPGHQIPYLYNFVGKPWKTQALTRRVMTEMYSAKPNGFVNNEDCGQMSAWYIFSALGFYPVAPADMNYYFGSPLFERSTLKLESGKKLIVKANRVSSKNLYIQSASLNGQQLNRFFITHEEIMNGGELVFEMGSKPNKVWATSEEAYPTYQKELAAIKASSLAAYTPFLTDQNYRFAEEKIIGLTSKNENAIIYYTLDGSDPNESSPVYKAPFEVKETCELKALAIQKGIKPSHIYRQKLVKSAFADLPYGYPKISFEETPSRGEEDGSQLIDMIYGSETFSDRKWTGLNQKNLVMIFDLGEEREISQVNLNTLTSTLKWRFPPKQISIETGISKSDLNPIAQRSYDKLIGEKKEINHHQFNFANHDVRYIRIRVNNYGTLPDWHQGAGKLPWIFVDEVNIN